MLLMTVARPRAGGICRLVALLLAPNLLEIGKTMSLPGADYQRALVEVAMEDLEATRESLEVVREAPEVVREEVPDKTLLNQRINGCGVMGRQTQDTQEPAVRS